MQFHFSPLHFVNYYPSLLSVYLSLEDVTTHHVLPVLAVAGDSFSSSIDSIYMGEYGHFRFYDRVGAKWDSTWTVMNNKGMLVISRNELIPPDSMAAYAEPGRLFKQDNNGLFFIIKLETARNHTWDEICRNHLYDTLVVTREMLEQTGNKIEYKR